MKTKITLLLLGAAIMFGSGSCVVGVRARAGHPGHHDRDYVAPQDNGTRVGFMTPAIQQTEQDVSSVALK